MPEIYSLPGFAEPVSCWTHLIGAMVFLVLSAFLVRHGRSTIGSSIPLAVFGLSAVFLLSMSGVYHLLPIGGTARDVLQRLDHAAIYVLIAGTITAVHAVLFTGFWRWAMILLAWVLAITAIVFKTIYFADFPESLGLITYLVFGWLGAVSAIMLWRKYGFNFIKPLWYGALAYTIGALLEFFRQPILIHGVIGPHEIFHVAVLLGIGYHWQFVHRSLTLIPILEINSRKDS